MKPGEDDSDWKSETNSIFGNNRGTNLAYDILCETFSSDNKENEIYNLSSNFHVNLQKLTTNVDNFYCAENVQRIRFYI